MQLTLGLLYSPNRGVYGGKQTHMNAKETGEENRELFSGIFIL